ncbi:MAG: response regulator [Oscillospiraceae bacterium]|nr:response regulator [Oscillospiraceae bacterium]
MYKILIAEDELIERKVLCKTLQAQFGDCCTILEAKNGREALALHDAQQPQIAVLDIEMPGMSGLEAARRMREAGSRSVILFLTAFDNFEYARQAIAVRAMEYLMKPYDERELILAMESAIHMADRIARYLPPARQPSRGERKGENDDGSIRVSVIREKIRGYIAEHYAEELSMQDVAQAMTYSDAYFCKLFKECFRVNFSAYLNEYRIEKAKAMLADPALSVRDIATACGYTDSNYFSRVFKRVAGQTPSEYRLTLEE